CLKPNAIIYAVLVINMFPGRSDSFCLYILGLR
ncbi:unnamed protein product, partial [marine sediment metagenome]